MSRGGDFWARRKAAVAEETAAEAQAAETLALAQEQAALEEKSDAEILAELELPDPDALEPGDDFSVFLAKAVPERIRRRALRKLWLSNPVLANLDELVDYGEDFTDSAMVIEGMQTAYQVGKGMLKHVEEMARQAAEKEADVVAEAEGDADEEVLALHDAEETVEQPEPETAAGDETEALEQSAAVDMAAEQAAPLRRRLRFDFAGTEQSEGMTQV